MQSKSKPFCKVNPNAMRWQEKALEILRSSLSPVPTELNELDWKSGLSPKTERLAQHVSAFANQHGGGLFVFGVDDNGGLHNVQKEESDEIVRTLGNIAANNLSYGIRIEHAILDYEGYALLFVYVPEQQAKPVYLRGKDLFNAYQRSGGQTIRMSHEQVRFLIARSQGLSFEEQLAREGLEALTVLKLLNYEKCCALMQKEVPMTQNGQLELLQSHQFCVEKDGHWAITNLGALLFANDISKFPTVASRGLIVRKYQGANNRELQYEQNWRLGYAVDFEELIDLIVRYTSQEKIGVVRETVHQYPKVAIRELVANALAHQDFSVTGMSISIEIYTNRLVVTNPGVPINDINRLIDLPPRSRNEILAQELFLLGMCERRGSGLDRVVASIEEMHLPPLKVTKGDQHTRVSLFPKKDFSEMTKSERCDACYQHACLLYEENEKLSNQSVRKRFALDKNQSAVASRVIADTLEAKLIKLADENITSKKYATYIPYYA